MISNSVAKQVVEAVAATGDAPSVIVARKGLAQVSDGGAINAAVTQVLAGAPDKVAQYRAGKEALFGFFVGQTMKAMGGKANPAVVNEVLKTALGESVAP